jgi:DNA modification methylase
MQPSSGPMLWGCRCEWLILMGPCWSRCGRRLVAVAADSTIADVLSGAARWCIHHGDILDALPDIPENSVDAVVCDAPYGLGEHPDAVKMLTAWLSDVDAKTNARGFMGRSWDTVPGPIYWRECYRVMKPGAYLLTFAGTRTQDLMGMAIRLAGFEVKDSVAWIYSTGFPKSVNLERQIAMHQCQQPGRHFASTLPRGSKAQPGDHICPGTEESLKWKGQGSALAPSHEPIIVARKPLDGTYAENTLKWGAALNIDATRIGTSKDVPTSMPKARSYADAGGMLAGREDRPPGDGQDPNVGRWPKNVLLQHDPRCRRIGTTTTKANPTWDTPNRDTEPSAFTGEVVSKVRHGREGEPSAERRYTEEGSTSFAATPGARRDAVEDVDVWECVDGCPCRMLGKQSGVSHGTAGIYHHDTGHKNGHSMGSGTPGGTDTANFGDSGTAARFFQQLHDDESDEPNFLYHAKPSRREKDAGLQHFRPRSAAEATHREDDQQGLESQRAGNGRTGGARNVHPTSKSIAVARWQVRLAARPGQLVLVPFAGSGTECIAALLEGCRVIGVELNDTDDEPFVSIAKARCEHIDGREYVPRESLRTKQPPRQGTLF